MNHAHAAFLQAGQIAPSPARTHVTTRPLTAAGRPRPGDVLLSRSNLALSQWMAWNAECPYSHAALALAPDVVLEARMPKVALRSLDAVLHESPARIDLYRPCNPDGSELSRAQQARVLDAGLQLLGQPFALARMPGLAWRTLLRHKLQRPARRRAPSATLAASDLSCCELVYLVLSEVCGFALADRSGRIRPRPPLRLGRLLREWRQTLPTRPPERRRAPPRNRCLHRLPADLITTDLISSPALRYVGTLLSAPR